jgi:hypothetical protein
MRKPLLDYIFYIIRHRKFGWLLHPKRVLEKRRIYTKFDDQDNFNTTRFEFYLIQISVSVGLAIGQIEMTPRRRLLLLLLLWGWLIGSTTATASTTGAVA